MINHLDSRTRLWLEINNYRTTLKEDGSEDLDDDYDDISIVRILQESFNTSANQTHKIMILTIFSHWSYQKIAEKFPTAIRHMISVAKSIAKDEGILSDPSPKHHPSLAVDAVNTVVNFFQSDDHTQCPGVTNVIEQLEKSFEQKCIGSITYKQWVTTERTSLQILKSSADEFLKNECIVIRDFSENYAFVIQNSV
ncbi:hypothetical protein PV325_004234 [Microctonus aethiopoides]|nr:hypothetical protein PV325_004234 [Microctonus aethiopoides]KAK0087036.1 hypothetical protein PV326_005315 [Microctonus aethiopoides]